jgi:hypothetical protein
LDKAVLDAYGFSPKKDVLRELLSLSQASARRITVGKPVAPQGVPEAYGREGYRERAIGDGYRVGNRFQPSFPTWRISVEPA